MNSISLVVFGLGCAGFGAAVMFFVNLLVKDHKNSVEQHKAEDRSDFRVYEILKAVADFENHHKNWRSPKASKIAIEKLIENIKSI